MQGRGAHALICWERGRYPLLLSFGLPCSFFFCFLSSLVLRSLCLCFVAVSCACACLSRFFSLFLLYRRDPVHKYINI